MSLITLLDLSATLLAMLAGLFFFKHLNAAYKIITSQACIAFVVELAAATSFKNYNHGMYNVYMIADCGLLMLAGFFLLKKYNHYFFIAGFTVFLLIWTWSALSHGLAYFAQLAFVVYSLMLVIIYIMVLYNEALIFKHSLYKFPALYLCSGIILFYACIIPYFSTFKLQANLTSAQQQFLHLLVLDVLDQLRYIFTAIGFFLFYINKEKLAEHEQ